MRNWKFAVRALSTRPGFSVTVVLLLTLGIGVTTALFSVVHTVLVQPLPFPHPDELAGLMEASAAKSQKESLMAPARVADWSRMSRTFQAISGSYAENVTDTSMSQPERLAGLRVAADYFRVYGMPAQAGRAFTADEEGYGGRLAAVISDGLWSRRYRREAGAVGKRLIVDGKAYTIVGVMPRAFTSSEVDVWIPAQLTPSLMQYRDARFYTGIGRMRPGVTVSQAQADLASVQNTLAERYPKTDKGWSAAVSDYRTARIGDTRKPLLLLFGAVLLLLLITLSNAASLTLAQLNQRQRELAIRTSIGGTRAQMVAMVMREAAVIAGLGALLGYAAARLSLKLLMRVFADTPRINELAIDWRALVFAVAASVVGAAAFGLIPALRATGATRGAGGSRYRGQKVLIGAQVALTMMLLASAGVLLRSFQNLSHVPMGFDPANLVLFHVGAAWDEDRAAIGRMQERLIGGLRRIPGVQAAGMANFLPASGATLRTRVTLEGIAGTDETGRMPSGSRLVSPGYLQALRVPLLAGKWCPELTASARPGGGTTMVNQRFADVYAGGRGVIGRHVLGSEIVGVIGDIREDSAAAPPYPYIYECASGGNWPDPEYLVRTSGDSGETIRSIREVVRGAAPGRAIFGMQTFEEALSKTLERPRSNARLLALFAAAALLLAAIGLYGLVTQLVNSRRRDLGIRMALGAAPNHLVGSMVGSVVRLIACGILAGAGLMLAARPLLQSLVFGVSGADPAGLIAAAGLLGAVSLVAAFLSARRAAEIDPTESLRADQA